MNQYFPIEKTRTECGEMKTFIMKILIGTDAANGAACLYFTCARTGDHDGSIGVLAGKRHVKTCEKKATPLAASMGTRTRTCVIRNAPFAESAINHD